MFGAAIPRLNRAALECSGSIVLMIQHIRLTSMSLGKNSQACRAQTKRGYCEWPDIYITDPVDDGIYMFNFVGGNYL